MASLLDIIQSAIVAAMISLMVLGVHLMTTKSSTENQIYQQMQGLADGALAIMQEEIRFLHSFVSDELVVSTNHLYFRNTDGNIVYIFVNNGALTIQKKNIGNQISPHGTGTVQGYDSSTKRINVLGNPVVHGGDLIHVSTPLGIGQWRFITNFQGGTIGIRGNWDFTPTTAMTYTIYISVDISSETYALSIFDQSADESFVFNLISLEADGSFSEAVNPTIEAKDVDLISVNFSIISDPDRFYQDAAQEYILDLQKDFYLRGFRLPSAGN